jgi:hypothetical protein
MIPHVKKYRAEMDGQGVSRRMMSMDYRSRDALQWMLIILALLWFAIRVANVHSEKGDLPFQSANDRSRWCTVRALVDHGTFAIDESIKTRGWNTIDKVYHADSEGVLHYYSSKPPLLSTVMAVFYWVLQSVTGWTLEANPFPVVRSLVMFFNGILLLILFQSVRSTANLFSRTPWGSVWIVAAATWGTHLTSFAVTFNNHLPAAAAIALANYLFWRLLQENQRPSWQYLVCGLAAALGFANELPALGFLVGISLPLFLSAPPRKVFTYVLGTGIILMASVFTNYLAHDTWAPPYLHRKTGANFETGNWYVFPKSYWLPENRNGIDAGEASRLTYAWHTTFGHHGILSLTPLWIMSVAGIWMWRKRPGGWGIVVLIGGLTIACIAFWIFRPLMDRNYSGRSTAFRWVLWMAPLWLMGAIPCADAWSRRRGTRILGYVLLAVSTASAAYGWYRPWQHPWLYREPPVASSSSKTAFMRSGQTTVASA